MNGKLEMANISGVVLLTIVLVAGCSAQPLQPDPAQPPLPPGPGQTNAHGEACHTSTFNIMVPTTPGTAPSLIWPQGVPQTMVRGADPQSGATHRLVRRGCRPTFTASGQETRMLIVFEETRDERGQLTNDTPFENMRGEPVWVFTARDAQTLRGRDGTVCSKYPGCKYSVVYTGGNGRHPPLDPWIIIN